MISARWFVNSPALPDRAAVEAYAARLGAVGIAGYTASNGEYRAILEITAECAAAEVAAMARKIKEQARRLAETAEGMRP